MKKLIIGVLALGSVSVFADQCAYLSKQMAQKAVKEIVSENHLKTLCEPCGETNAKKIKVESLGYQHTGYGDYYEVTVNGKGVDLAYLYAQNLNVSKLVGCPSSLVSEEL